MCSRRKNYIGKQIGVIFDIDFNYTINQKFAVFRQYFKFNLSDFKVFVLLISDNFFSI